MGSQPLKKRGQADLAMGLARAKFGDIREAVRKRSVSLGEDTAGRPPDSHPRHNTGALLGLLTRADLSI